MPTNINDIIKLRRNNSQPLGEGDYSSFIYKKDPNTGQETIITKEKKRDFENVIYHNVNDFVSPQPEEGRIEELTDEGEVTPCKKFSINKNNLIILLSIIFFLSLFFWLLMKFCSFSKNGYFNTVREKDNEDLLA
jgi:hypothetical protein